MRFVPILGIHNASDAGVCLIKNNKVLAAISEERLNRKKMYIGFPHKSLKSRVANGVVRYIFRNNAWLRDS